MNAQNSWLSQSNVNVIFLENQNILTIHIDSTLPSPSFYALPLFTNFSADSESPEPLIVYQIPPCTTSNQIPIASVTSLHFYLPLSHSIRIRQPPDRFGFTPHLSLTATFSSISIPTCYK
ncbi:hypothetical protein ACOSQ2_005080 [Xanthoceras sorbifolium]